MTMAISNFQVRMENVSVLGENVVVEVTKTSLASTS